MFAVGDVEIVGAIDRETGRLVQTLGGGRSGIGGSVAGVALARDREPDNGTHRTRGINLADAVILRVRDVLIPVRVEDDVGGSVETDRRCGSEVPVEARRDGAGVPCAALQERQRLRVCKGWGKSGCDKGDKVEEDPETGKTVNAHLVKLLGDFVQSESGRAADLVGEA
jgi:hypothetical protein